MNDPLMLERQRIMQREMERFLLLLSPEMRERLNPELQKALIESLLDGTVFPIVDSLKDLQRMNETRLYEDRQQRLLELQSVPDLDEQMRIIDISIVNELDKILAEQQNTLSRAGVPGFRITSNPREIALQMEMIHFIMSVHDKLP